MILSSLLVTKRGAVGPSAPRRSIGSGERHEERVREDVAARREVGRSAGRLGSLGKTERR
eukprot:3434096-Heterocapsa_arctica.AAC.1